MQLDTPGLLVSKGLLKFRYFSLGMLPRYYFGEDKMIAS